ncbi:MAG: sugar ABC transporter permease [Thermotoga sp.]|nr:MAG: sugar ABC transporter permease [Thermotoga sp.]HDM70201.1 sugar ABC transporter permease [Thermotogales bacterium]
MKSRSLKDTIVSYLFCAPAYLIFTIFIFVPIIWSFILSFTDYSLLTFGKPEFVGLANYIELFKDPVFLRAVLNTIYYSILYVPTTLVIGFIFALMLNDDFPGRNFFRLSMFIPVVVPMVVASIVWMLILSAHPTSLANRLLGLFGIPPKGWLTDPKLAMLSVAMVMVWKTFGYKMLLYLAAMQSIPYELYESAELDGATGWKKTIYITIPLLKPTTFFLVVTSVIDSFQIFTPIYIMTGGGPGYATTTLVNYLYEKGFKEFEMGYASAISYVLFLMLIILTFIQKKGFGSEEIF